jgi:precorrin-6B methylase 2
MKIQDLEESSGYSLAGSFTHDLTTSKVWLMQELARISPRVGTVYVLGSWFGNLSLYMALMPMFKHGLVINVETDSKMLKQSARMLDRLGADDVEHMLKDANDLDYRQLGQDGVVINTSLTDMPGRDWFRNIPKNTLVVMQARDHDPGRQFSSTQDILDRFPLSTVLYEGELDLEDPETEYTRFMVIGRK